MDPGPVRAYHQAKTIAPLARRPVTRSGGRQNLILYSQIHAMSSPSDTFALPEEVEMEFWRARDVLHARSQLLSEQERLLKKTIETCDGIFAPIPCHDLAAFNRVFFERNLLKCLVVIHRFKSLLAKAPILDIGCGAGAATIAWLLTMNLDPRQVASSECVDRSKEQLATAKQNVQSILRDEPLPRFASDISPNQRVGADALTFLSFFLCEAYAEGVAPSASLAMCSNTIIAVDYREVLTRFVSDIGHWLGSSELFQETYELPSDVRQILGQDTLRVMGLHAIKRD